MSFDLLTPLEARIAAKLTNTPALVQEVRIGSPASLGYQVTASLTLAGGTPNPEDFDTEGLAAGLSGRVRYDTAAMWTPRSGPSSPRCRCSRIASTMM
jgi:hypothetical protein